MSALGVDMRWPRHVSTIHWEIKGRFRKRVVLANVPSFRFPFWGNMRTYPRSGFRSGGTSECTLVAVFVPGEHPPKPPFWKTTLLATPHQDAQAVPAQVLTICMALAAYVIITEEMQPWRARPCNPLDASMSLLLILMLLCGALFLEDSPQKEGCISCRSLITLRRTREGWERKRR